MIKPLYIVFTSQVSEGCAQLFIKGTADRIRAESINELHLLLSTLGGSISDGLTIYNWLRSTSLKITTYNIGNVNSIGNIVFLAGDKRYASPFSSFMFHGGEVNICNENMRAKEIHDKSELITNTQKAMSEIIIERTKFSIEDLNKMYMSATYLDAEEAKAKGHIDEIISIEIPKNPSILHVSFLPNSAGANQKKTS